MVREEVGPDDVAEVVAAWTGIPAGRLLEGETAKLLRMEEELGHRVVGQARGRAGRVRRRAPRPRRRQRPRPPDRLVPVPRPDRRRQDRAGEGARGVPLRRRARDDPHRHERVRREALGRAARRRPARLRRLRRGRPAHRGRAAPPVHRRAVRRGREGAPRGLRRPAAGARRRPPHRRPGPHGRLPQRDPRADVQPRLERAGRPDAVSRGAEERGRDGRRARELQAGVPQPPRRHRDVPPARDRGAVEHRGAAGRLAAARACATGGSTLEVTPAARDWLALNGFDPAYGARPLRRLVQTAIGDRLAKAILVRRDRRRRHRRGRRRPGRGRSDRPCPPSRD